MAHRLWTLVLAGGAGRRLATLTGGIPKQFWSADGGASLLEDTLARIAPLCPPARRVTVVDQSHRRHVEVLRHRAPLGRVVYQPEDRGTAAGILLGLTAIRARDPDAIALVTPADHGIERQDDFVRGLSAAVDFARSSHSGAVLFGAEPTRPAGDLGWITSAPANGGDGDRPQFLPVVRFTEKPGASEAARLLEEGAVWNTMVLVGRAAAVVELCRRHAASTAEIFSHAPRSISALERFAREAYPTLHAADFSRDVIARSAGLALYVWPARMGWSDLGTLDRVAEWRARQGALSAGACADRNRPVTACEPLAATG